MTENNGTPEQPPGTPPPAEPPVYSQWGYPPPQPPQPSPYPPPPYYQPMAQYGVPDHPKATTALVLGLVGLVGGFTCLLPMVLSPFAWAIGVKARREIRQSNGQLGGDGSATAGMVLGIIGTVLLTLAVIALVVLVILLINDPGTFDDTTV